MAVETMGEDAVNNLPQLIESAEETNGEEPVDN